ncbi:hypothetical protein [Streptococcus mutans]|uniref:hypothetical protein n=1 Tax=Streptococcus mutans TaxID=1309 RepID=UPI001425BC62|nr:hypothetical protein [Streptococcus mutans]QIQ93783.1 hypothetical protein HB753_04445 [Streptococcus mutans]QIR00028.1 hypothetical protein HB752_04445 [Streptococcus mutans]QIR01673.1 hypothetical protein HB751_03060 [Streptococcus mutans]QIR03804.1 hypothetical protein HB750_04445 [Streptococcus mutans]
MDLQSVLDQEKFKEALENFGNEKSVLINKVSIVYLIIQDILSYTNIGFDFEKYEKSFWYQYQKETALLYNNRSEFKELYLSSLFFILLYANRIRLGKMDFKFFKYLFNTNPEYKSLVEKVRPIFEGTKQSTIFSKVFERFISQQLFPDFKRRLKSKEEWKKAKQIIEKNIDPNSRQEVVAENLKKTEREINDFLQFLNTKFKLIVDETNKFITALNKKQIEVSSWITEPLTEDELSKNNYIWFSNFINSNGEKEFGMVKDEKYSKISMADLYSPSIMPELVWGIYNYFSKKSYYYKAEFPDRHIEYGKVYFYDFDKENVSGRYKSSEDTTARFEEMEIEERYGRFQFNLKNKQLFLTTNGGHDTLGKYGISLQNVKFEENQILAETQYRNGGTVSLTFAFISN